VLREEIQKSMYQSVFVFRRHIWYRSYSSADRT